MTGKIATLVVAAVWIVIVGANAQDVNPGPGVNAQSANAPTEQSHSRSVRNKTSPKAEGTAVMSKTLPDWPGKEVVIMTVTYPPGGSDPVHRHTAHGFIYVLEGSVVMAVKGGEPVTLSRGQTFYEGPTDIHAVGRNASTTKPASFLVFMIKDKGAPVVIR